jgi:dTMP kinase
MAAMESALRAASDDPPGTRSAGLLPVFSSSLGTGAQHGVQSRIALSWWGLIAGDDPPPGLRDAYHALLRALHPDRYLRYLAYESQALGGCDLYSDALRDQLLPPAPGPPRRRALVVAVCGIDGAGKSSHVRALAEHLQSQGLRVAIHKIYRHGVFHETVTELTRSCAGERNLHLWRVERLAKAFDSVKCLITSVQQDLDRHDVVLFDRYTQTHFAAGVGRCHYDPLTRELLACFPDADLWFLLDLPVGDALVRIGTRAAPTVDENPYMLGRYRAMLQALARGPSACTLDARAPFESNQERMRERIDALLAARGAR